MSYAFRERPIVIMQFNPTAGRWYHAGLIKETRVLPEVFHRQEWLLIGDRNAPGDEHYTQDLSVPTMFRTASAGDEAIITFLAASGPKWAARTASYNWLVVGGNPNPDPTFNEILPSQIDGKASWLVSQAWDWLNTPVLQSVRAEPGDRVIMEISANFKQLVVSQLMGPESQVATEHWGLKVFDNSFNNQYQVQFDQLRWYVADGYLPGPNNSQVVTEIDVSTGHCMFVQAINHTPDLSTWTGKLTLMVGL
ncbi:MAG: hypothetical protein HY902_09130 [Deltaproteobacteria bacterium]|nr:hypothetical protein [Deltaproteobacteria bacterium]